MAVALGTGTPTRSITPATGSSATSASWTISGSDLLILVHIGLNSATATVSSVSWSLGSGTPVQVGSSRGGSAFASVWAIPAPTAGSGTFTVNLSASVPYQISADYFTGCDQSTPCPAGDIDTDTGDGTGVSITWTPANVGANDAAAVNYTHTVSGDTQGFTAGTVTFHDITTTVNIDTAYRLGNNTITAAAMTGGTGANVGSVAVHIAEPGAAGASQRFMWMP